MRNSGVRLSWVGFAAVLALLLVIPFVSKNYFIFQMTQMLIYAIAIMGLNLLTGFNGQVSLGHGAFYAVGAYVTVILIKSAGIPWPLAVPVSGLICMGFGYLFGFPALRLEGVYLALATFALAIAMPQLLKLSFLADWTGGVQGLSLKKFPVPFGLPLNLDQFLYLTTVLVGLLVYFLLSRLIDSPTGRAFMAIRDNPIAARSMGIDVSRTKAQAFGVSALITGIAGAMSALVVRYVSPDSYSFFLSISLFVGMIIGGVGWLPGCLFGAAFILFVPNYAEEVSQGLSGAVYGAALIALIYIAPNGAAGLLASLKSMLANLIAKRSSREEPNDPHETT